MAIPEPPTSIKHSYAIETEALIPQEKPQVCSCFAFKESFPKVTSSRQTQQLWLRQTDDSDAPSYTRAHTQKPAGKPVFNSPKNHTPPPRYSYVLNGISCT